MPYSRRLGTSVRVCRTGFIAVSDGSLQFFETDGETFLWLELLCSLSVNGSVGVTIDLSPFSLGVKRSLLVQKIPVTVAPVSLNYPDLTQ